MMSWLYVSRSLPSKQDLLSLLMMMIPGFVERSWLVKYSGGESLQSRHTHLLGRQMLDLLRENNMISRQMSALSSNLFCRFPK